MLKHCGQYHLMIKLANEKHLGVEFTLFLLALREQEDGIVGNELRIKAAQGTDLKEQILWAIGSIKKNEIRWQEHILNKGWIDFEEFFAFHGGPYATGWCANMGWVNNIKQFIKEIKEDYYGFAGVDTQSKQL